MVSLSCSLASIDVDQNTLIKLFELGIAGSGLESGLWIHIDTLFLGAPGDSATGAVLYQSLPSSSVSSLAVPPDCTDKFGGNIVGTDSFLFVTCSSHSTDDIVVIFDLSDLNTIVQTDAFTVPLGMASQMKISPDRSKLLLASTTSASAILFDIAGSTLTLHGLPFALDGTPTHIAMANTHAYFSWELGATGYVDAYTLEGRRDARLAPLFPAASPGPAVVTSMDACMYTVILGLTDGTEYTVRTLTTTLEYTTDEVPTSTEEWAITALTPTCSLSAVARLDGTSTECVLSSLAMSHTATPLPLVSYEQEDHTCMGRVVALTDSWLALYDPVNAVAMPVRLCPFGSILASPGYYTAGSTSCDLCPSLVSSISDINDCSVSAQARDTNPVFTGVTGSVPLVVSGNTYARADPSYSGSSGAIYISSVDSIIAGATSPSALVGTNSFGRSLSVSDHYAAIGTTDGEFIRVYDTRVSLTDHLFDILPHGTPTSFAMSEVAIHPTKFIVAATAMDPTGVVQVFFGSSWVDTLVPASPSSGFGHTMRFTESFLIACDFESTVNLARVYRLTGFDSPDGSSASVSLYYSFQSSASGETLINAGGTDDYLLLITRTGALEPRVTVFDVASTSEINNHVFAFGDEPFFDCDVGSGRCAMAMDSNVAVFDLTVQPSSTPGDPFYQTYDLSSAMGGASVRQFAINSNAMFLAGDDAAMEVRVDFTACQKDRNTPYGPVAAFYSPAFMSCAPCPLGTYSPGFEVKCRPIPYGGSPDGTRSSVTMQLSVTTADVGFVPHCISAKNHALAAASSMGTVAVFDVDFAGLHGHGPFLTKPSSVGASSFGTAVAVTESGHVIVGSASATALAHGISIFELTHDSAVYVRSFFKYISSCEYGRIIESHGDYVAVGAPGSACEAVDVYNTAAWTKASVTAADLAPDVVADFPSHIAIDNDYVYAACDDESDNGIVYVLSGFDEPGAILSKVDVIEPNPGLPSGLPVLRLIADALTETLFVQWEAPVDVNYGIYRRGGAPGEDVMHLALGDAISGPPLSVSYFNGELHWIDAAGETFTSSSDLLDARKRSSLSNTDADTEFNGEFTYIDGLPIFHSASDAHKLGVLLPIFSDAPPGEEMLGPGYFRPCPDGYYSPGHQALCTKCPPHYASNTGHTACVPEYTVSTVDPGVAVTAISTYKDAMAAVSYTEGCGTDTGSVFLHEYDGTAWALTETLTPPASGCVGLAVAINDDWLAVSSEFDDGLVLVYSRSTLDLTASVTPADAGTGFGWSLALAGDSLLVGAPTSSTNGQPGAGVVFVFEHDSSGWPTGPDHTLTASVPLRSERFGASIDVKVMPDGSFAVAVGTAPSSNPGSVFMFDTPSWSVSQAAIGTDPSFSHEVAVISHDELFTAGSDEVIRIHFHDFIYDAYIIDSAVTAAYGDALGAFGDQVVSSATSYFLYGHDTGAFTVSGYEPTPSSMGDAGFLFPPSERLVDSMGFGQPASTMGSGVMFATDAQSTAITCIHPTCTAGQHADTWYSCADCPPYTVGDGQTCANYTAPTYATAGMYVYGIAVSDEMIVLASPVSQTGFGASVYTWNENWTSKVYHLNDPDLRIGFGVALNDDWLVLAAYDTVAAKGCTVVYSRTGSAFTDQTTIDTSTSSTPPLVALSGNDVLRVDPTFTSTSCETVVISYTTGSGWARAFTPVSWPGTPTNMTMTSQHYAIGFPDDGLVITDYNDGSWGSTSSIDAGVDRFGQSLALDGDMLMVGAPDAFYGAGAMYSYKFDGSAWNLRATITPNDPVMDGAFPSSIAIHNGHVAIGWEGCAIGDNIGCILLFDRVSQGADADSWAQTAAFSHPSTPGVGAFVAIGEKTLISIGSWMSAFDRPTLTLNALCDRGYFADTWYSCAACQDGYYATAHSLRCSLCPVGMQSSADQGGCTQVAELSSVVAGTANDDSFGHALSAVSDLVAVSTSVGHAFVYRHLARLSSPYMQLEADLAHGEDTLFGGVVAISLTWLAVSGTDMIVVYPMGSDFTEFIELPIDFAVNRMLVDDELIVASSNDNRVLTFQYDGTTWSGTSLSGPAWSNFGASIALTSAYLFIGSPGTDTVSVYDRADLSGSPVAVHTAATTSVGFGSTLAAVDVGSDTRVAVGCPQQAVGADIGAVQIFSFVSAAFVLEAVVYKPDASIPASMLLDETALLASDPLAAVGGESSAGAFFSFQYNGLDDQWQSSVAFTAITPTANEQVGQAIAAGDACLFYSSTPTGSPGNVYVTCAVCPAGQKPVSWRLCEPCPAGMYSEAGLPGCRACPAGYTINTDQTGCDAPYTAESHNAPPPIVAGELGTVVRIQGDQFFALYGTKTMTPNVERYTYSSATKAWEDAGMVLSSSALPTPAAHTASFDVSEHWLAVGSPSEAKIYVYSRADASFDQLDALEPPGLASQPTSFGSAIAMTDIVIVSGTPDTLTGQVDVFSFNGAHWEPQFVFTSSLAAAGDLFGTSVAISPDTSFIVASDTLNGKVYVLNYTAELTSIVTESQTIAGSESFGMSLAATETTIVVGSPTATVLGVTGAGSATVLTLVDGEWTPLTTLTAPYPEAEGFGSSVAIDEEDTIVVGAPDFDSGVGRVHIFAYDGSDWAYEYHLDSPDSATASFGASVASNTQFLAVGAPALSTDTGGLSIITQPCPAYDTMYMASWHNGCESCIGPYVSSSPASEGTYCPLPRATKSYAAVTGSNKEYGYAIAVTDELVVISTRFASTADGENVVEVKTVFDTTSSSIPNVRIAEFTQASIDYGKALAITDDRLAIGAFSSVEVYRRVGSIYIAYDPLALTPAESSFGDALAMWGDYLVVGVPSAAVGSITGAGLVVVYKFVSDTIVQVATIDMAGVSGRGADALGTSLLEHGGTLFIGAPGANTVFAVDESDWSTITQVITATLPTATVSFGSFMAYDDVYDLILISDPDADMFGTAQGAVVAFESINGVWTQLTWIRSAFSDMTRFGRLLAASDGFLAAGAPAVFHGPAGSVEVMAFDNSSRRYTDVHYVREESDIGSGLAMLPNTLFRSREAGGNIMARTRACDGGSYAKSFAACEPCLAGQYSATNARACMLCPPGQAPNADQDGCVASVTLHQVSLSSVGATEDWGATTAVYEDYMLMLGDSGTKAYIFIRGVSEWMQLKELRAYLVADAAIDGKWIVLAGGIDGLLIYRLDPRSATLHSSFGTVVLECLKVGLKDNNIAALDAGNSNTAILGYDSTADSWSLDTTAPVYGTTLAVHADLFAVGQGTSVNIAPWPAECEGGYASCVTPLTVAGSDALLILDNLLFAASVSIQTVEVFINTGTVSSPAWTLGQTLTEPEGGVVSLAASNGIVFAGIPSYNSEDGAVRVIRRGKGGVWAIEGLITGPANNGAQMGASVSATSSSLVMGAPATDPSSSVLSRVVVATMFCPANEFSDTFYTCSSCKPGMVSKAGAMQCSLCGRGTALAPTGDECQPQFIAQTITVSGGEFGSSIALGDNLFLGVDHTQGKLLMARFDPWAQTWTEFTTLTGAMTGVTSRLIAADDFIVFGDPHHSTDSGRVGVIRREGYKLEQPEFIDPPTSDLFFGWQIALSGTTLVVSSPGSSWTNILISIYDLSDGSDIGADYYGDSCLNFAVYGRMMVCSSDAGATTVYPDFADKDTAVSLTPTPDTVAASIVITDDLILVGSPDDTSHTANDVSTGAVYVYLNDGDTYPLKTVITTPNLETATTRFGASMTMLDSTTVAVGSPGDPYDSSTFGQLFWFTFGIDSELRWADELESVPLAHSRDVFAGISAHTSGAVIAYSLPAFDSVSLFHRSCTAGSYPNSFDSCVACDPGTVSAANSLFCSPCPAGLAPNSDNSACEEVLEGKMLDVGSRTLSFYDVHAGLAAFKHLDDDTLKLFTFDSATGSWTHSGTIAPSASLDGNWAVAQPIITDEHIIVGSGATATGSGAALVYDRWSLDLVDQILPPDASVASASFSYNGARVDDSHVILADYKEQDMLDSSPAGAIHLYRLVLDQWTLIDSFIHHYIVGFGHHVTVRGSTVAVDTYEPSPYTTSGASLYVYEFTGATLDLTNSVVFTGYQDIDKAMDISPDEGAVVVACMDTSAANSDSFAVFEFIISTGEISTVDEGNCGLTNCAKSQAVAHAGDAIYYGTPYSGSGQIGEVTVYQRVAPGFWSPAHTLGLPGGAASDGFGESLRITHDGLVVVGAEGAVLIFSRYECPAGEVVASWLECGPVPSGSIAYSNSHTRCLNGSYADNSTTCVPCDAGTYQPDKGATECLSADAGFFVPDDGYAHAAPIECPVATSQTAAESTSCTRSYGIQTLNLGVSSYTPAVALDDDLLLVGLPETNQLSLYTAVLSVWTHNATVTPPSAATDFGHAMVLRDDWLAVGAPSLTDAGAGAVFVYTRDGHTFPFHSTLTATSTAEFGKSLDLQYPLLAALAWDDSAGTSVVEFFLYDETNEEWIDQENPTAIDGVALSVGIMSLAPSIRFAVGLADESRVCAFSTPCTGASSVQFSRIVSATSAPTVAFGDGALDTGFAGHRTAAGSFGMWASDTDTLFWPDFDPIEDQGLGRAVAVHGSTVAATDAFGAVHLFSRASGSATTTVHIYLTDDGFDPDPGFGHGLAVDPMSMAVVSLVDGAYELSMIGMTCDAGNFADSWHSCAPCPAGSYSPAPGYWECVDAPPGSVVPSDGRSTPEVCDGGHFADSPGADICQTCDTGSTNDADGHGHSTCLSEVEDSTTSVEVSGRSDIDAITVDGVAATIISTSPVEIIPIVGSSDGAIHPGDYELEVEFSDSTIESTTLTIPADVETPGTTLTLSGTTLTAAMESRICPSNLPFAAMGVRPLTGMLTAGTVTCVSDETVSGSNLADSFSPSISKRAEGEYCLTMTDVTLTGTTAFTILIDNEEQTIVLSDNAICSTAASASTTVSTQAYLSADTRTIVATFDGTEIASDSETYNEVSVLYAVIPSFAVASLLLLGCLCCTCILGVAGSAIVVEVVMLFRTKSKGSDDEDLKPQPIVGSTPTVLPPMDLPPLPRQVSIPTQPGRPSLSGVGGINVPAGLRPTLPPIRQPLGQSPTASPMKQPISPPAGTPPASRLPPALGRSGLPPMVGMPRPGAKLVLSPLQMPGVGVSPSKKD
ncbi:FG-GAP repeat [Carpediemonas membranifera]|uniref:FG-GAP repeat n=1 Tax=Carpediemonas membranifera TaxID=201153 RepID=A0A8J6AXP1_9EUKA|nr:FG-GAP repeat [Carpediemonas membranifera]|eukprot:KAG9389809.1 FG-GAP repeat [Carpediemonas membranifera]